MTEEIMVRLRHALGETMISRDQEGKPVASPDSLDGLAQVCGLAHENSWRVRVEGQCTWMPPDAPADLAVTTRAMDRVVEISPADLVATIEAGLPIARLQQQLAHKGAWLAVDPPGRPDRSVGSVVATGTAGALRHGYGPVRDHILGGTIVTGDGRIVRAGGSVVKNVAGYDLTKLQVGGFGAFGVIAQLHLRLRAAPVERATLLARGERDLLTHQSRTMMERRIEVAAMELLSPALVADAEWMLALEVAGTAELVAAEVARAMEYAEVPLHRLSPERSAGFWPSVSRATQGGPITLRLGAFPDSIDEMIDLLSMKLDVGLVSAGPGRGLLRWSGDASPEAIRGLRRVAAEREVPLTLERAPWELRRTIGHFGAYREGVGRLVTKLRATFDPQPTFAVALEGVEDG